MAGITLAEAEEQLQKYRDAETKALKAQSYQVNGRSLDRPDLKVIGERIEYWDRKVKELSGAATGNGRRRTLSPGW